MGYVVIHIHNNSVCKALNAYNDLDLAKALVRELATDTLGYLTNDQENSLYNKNEIVSENDFDNVQCWSIVVLE